jgi:hypothetical protein
MVLAVHRSMARLVSGGPNLCSTSSSLRMVSYGRHVIPLAGKDYSGTLLSNTSLRHCIFISNSLIRKEMKWVEAEIRGSWADQMLSKRPVCASNRTVERHALLIAATGGHLGQWIPRRWRADPSVLSKTVLAKSYFGQEWF